nr:TldD/PmbA family protein [Brachyspira pilosicoli]
MFHEACGHALEATAVADNASVFCNKLGKKIASDVVTAIDDGTIKNAWGSYNIDDEGNDAQRTVLIENGILKSYLVDELGSIKMNQKVTGSARRESYKYAPTSRMRNTFIDKGNSTFEELISGIEYGLYAKKMGGGSVYPATTDYNFAVSEGYLIENGKITKPVRGATLIGRGDETLMNIEAVSSNLELADGICGSISGSVPTTVGQPAIRVKELTVGGR